MMEVLLSSIKQPSYTRMLTKNTLRQMKQLQLEENLNLLWSYTIKVTNITQKPKSSWNKLSNKLERIPKLVFQKHGVNTPHNGKLLTLVKIQLVLNFCTLMKKIQAEILQIGSYHLRKTAMVTRLLCISKPRQQLDKNDHK